MNNGFTPVGATVNLTVSGASQALALNTAGAGDTVYRIANLGTLVTFVTFGSSAVTTTASVGMPIPINGVVYVSLGNSVTHLAAIGSGAGSVLYVTAGAGGVYG